MSTTSDGGAVSQIIVQPDIEEIILLDRDEIRRRIEGSLKPKPKPVSGSQRFRVKFYVLHTSNIVPSAGAGAISQCSIQCFGVPQAGSVSDHAMFYFLDPHEQGVRAPKVDPVTGKISLYFHMSQIPMVLAQLDRGRCDVVFDVLKGLATSRLENEPIFRPV